MMNLHPLLVSLLAAMSDQADLFSPIALTNQGYIGIQGLHDMLVHLEQLLPDSPVMQYLTTHGNTMHGMHSTLTDNINPKNVSPFSIVTSQTLPLLPTVNHPLHLGGVYVLNHILEGMQYVGSTTEFAVRLIEHHDAIFTKSDKLVAKIAELYPNTGPLY